MKTQNSKMQSLKEVTAISYTPPLHIPEQAGCTLQIIIDEHHKFWLWHKPTKKILMKCCQDDASSLHDDPMPVRIYRVFSSASLIFSRVSSSVRISGSLSIASG